MSDKTETSATAIKATETLQARYEREKKDQSWKRPEEIGEDGYVYRTQRVENEDKTFTIIRVRVGKEPRYKKGD